MKMNKLLLTFAFFRLSFGVIGQIEIQRGPYLQMATQESIIIRWDTDVPTSSRVTFGFDLFNHFGARFDTTSVLKHEVELTGLVPNTTYSYSIGSIDSIIRLDSELYFKTLPEKGETGEYSFFVIGDAGQGSQAQRDVSLAFQNEYGNHHDGVILLGDNAYWSGTQTQYQNNFFDGFYNEIFENTVIWPSPGNHDYYGATIPMTPTAPYFDIFNIPTNAECGGIASSTEQYYSFDYGNIHFISLDSYAVDRADTAEMANWLLLDLQANTLPWIIAFWHHPPYSKGSHDSDNAGGNDFELVEMRENIVPLLEQFNVDLVLSGHSHSYERSKLIANHYGSSNTFTSSHLRSRFSGNEQQDCAYYKYTDTANPIVQGGVYAVVGVSGWLSAVNGGWPHPVMHSYSNQKYGAMRIEVVDNRLTAEFLTKENELFDRFTIFKNVNFPESSFDCSETTETTWSFSPNPSASELVLHRYGYYPNEQDFYTVFDVNGNLIRRVQLKEINAVKMEGLNAGIYFIHIHEGQEIQQLKFMKL